MKKPFMILASAACLLAFLILVPAAPGQSPQLEGRVIALAQQLKLTPQQEAEVLPILKAEAPKLEAIKNDSSLSGMQKASQLRAIHSETSAPLQKILPPAQYEQLQTIREEDMKKAIAAKRESQGTGMGLAIAYTLIEAHGGHTLYSRARNGAAFFACDSGLTTREECSPKVL
jgi:hypothetical protein